MNEVRLELFLKKYQPRKKEEVVISCVKKMEGSVLLPCASVLQQTTNRTITLQANGFHHGRVTHQYQTL